MGNMPDAERFTCHEGTCHVLTTGGIMLHNKSVNADAQGRPPVAPALSLAAGQVRR